MIRSVTVYCSSSSAIPPVYFQAGEALGRAIAREGWTLVYGGNDVGLMGRLAGACRAGGGKVVGITPRLFVDKGIADQCCDDLVVCESMRERKAIMEDRGDAFVAMPGGLGTFEEVFEIIVGRQLGYHQKPIALFNVADYFAPLLAMVEHGIEHRFIKSSVRELYHVAADVEGLLAYLKSYKPPTTVPDKWFSHTLPPSAAE